MSGGPERRYWLQRGIGPEGPYPQQTIIEFIDRGLRVADVALDGEPEWTALDRHPDFAPTIEAARRARDAKARAADPPKTEEPAARKRVPASHPDVAAFLDRGVRTGPTLGPKAGLVVLGALLLIGLVFVAIDAHDIGALGIPALLVAVAMHGLLARRTVVVADRRGIGRVGWRRSWDDFESIDVERRKVTTLSRRGTITEERLVVITRFRFRRGSDLRVTTDAMTHTRELTRYAEITKAARRNRVPEERLDKVRATLAAPKPSAAFPLGSFVVFVLLATPIAIYATYESSGREGDRASQQEPPRGLDTRAVEPEPVYVPPPGLGELTVEALQRRAATAGYEELDPSTGPDGLSLITTVEHRRSSSAAPERFLVHFFDLDHLPSSGEPTPDDCRLFDEHIVCARGLGSRRLLADLDPTVTLSGLAIALEGAGHTVEGERELRLGRVIDQLSLEVHDSESPIAIRGSSWQRAMEDPDEDTVAAVAGRQAMVVRKTGRLGDAATVLEQLAGVD